jgi:hypothetical protein
MVVSARAGTETTEPDTTSASDTVATKPAGAKTAKPVQPGQTDLFKPKKP